MLGRMQALGSQLSEHIGLMLRGITLAHSGHGLRDGRHASLRRTFKKSKALPRHC